SADSALARAGNFGPGASTLGAQEARDLGITTAGSPTVLESLVNVPRVGTAVRTVGGRASREPVTIVRCSQLGRIHRAVHAVSSPSSAYLLHSIGRALLIFELFTAGVGVAGVVGATCCVFGCYGIAAMPTRTVSLALGVLAFAALA